MSIYEAVERAAKAAGTTVNAVEKEAGLAKGTIGKWRTAAPRINNLLKVARVLNVDINELTEGVNAEE